MPIKWTADNDQLLLLKILETSAINANVKAIAEAWPTDKGERPTPRAVSERLVKIRQLAKANGAGHFTVTSANAVKPSGPRTPRKPRVKKSEESRDASDTPATDTSGGKRKRTNGLVVKTEKVDYDSSAEDAVGSPQGTGEGKQGFDADAQESPTKKLKGLCVGAVSGGNSEDSLVYDEEEEEV